MGDGWSAKDTSPAVYTPAAANTPQLEIDTIPCHGVFSSVQDAATITSKITPASPMLFSSFDLTPRTGTSNAGFPNSAVCLENDAGDIFSTWVSGANVKIFKINKLALTWAQVGTTIVAPGTFSTAMNLARNFGNGRLVIAAASGRGYTIASTDHGASWANWLDTGAITGLSIKQMSAASAEGTFIISGYRTIGGFAQPVCVRITGWGTGVSVVDMPSVSGMTGAAFTGVGCCMVADGTFLLCAQPASGNAYVFLSTNSGATWTHVHTTSGTTLTSAGNYGYGRYLGNNACVFMQQYGTSNGKALVCESSGTVFNFRSTPNNINMPILLDRQNYSKNTNQFANGTAYFVGYTGSFLYVGVYVTTDYCQTFRQLTTQNNGSPYFIVSETEDALIYHYENIESASGTVTNSYVRLYKTGIGVERFVAMLGTAAFSATSPAKLASLGTCTPSINSTSKQGTVKLYLQHYNDEIGAWSSLSDVAGVWTDCGTLADSTPLSLPSCNCRAGEKFIFRIGFTATDPTGIQSAPELLSLSFAWASDVAAPDSPSITRILDTTISGQVGYRVDFNIPANSRHVIVEGDLNSTGYLPLSNRAKFEADNSHLRFMGDLAQIEGAGERNETHYSSLKGLVENDTIKVRLAAEDSVGNRSAFTESDLITLHTIVNLPTIVSFTAVPGSIGEGGTSTLSWEVTGATTVTIDNSIGVVSATGTTDVTPAGDIMYTITAENATGSVMKSVMVSVIPASIPIPVISLTLTPANINSGESVTISWSVTDADEVFLNGSMVAASGSVVDSPTITTGYTITADNAAHTVETVQVVEVTPIPTPTIAFAIDVNPITEGESATLSWTVADATNVELNGVPVAVSDTLLVSPTVTTGYRLYAFNSEKNAENTIVLEVTPVVVPEPTISFTATPGTIDVGNSSTLSWTVANSTSVSIDNGIGAVSASGSQVVSPIDATMYTLTATGPGGTESKSVVVKMTGGGGSYVYVPVPTDGLSLQISEEQISIQVSAEVISMKVEE